MYNKLINKETKLSVIGLGYVGLPIALEFAKQIRVVGFDIKPERVDLMKKGIDPSNELTSEAFKNTDIVLTSDPSDLKTASFHIIAVPTPVSSCKQSLILFGIRVEECQLSSWIDRIWNSLQPFVFNYWIVDKLCFTKK